MAGEDGPGRPALPAGELLHPVPLAALVLLLLNDWVLKGSTAVPGALTGVLSDVAGLILAPLCATATADSLLWAVARAGAPVDFSLRRWKLAGATVACGAGFVLVKLWPPAALALEHAAAAIGLAWQVVPDPTDLVALPALALAWAIGRREIARVPLGRLEVLARRARRRPPRPVAAEGLADVIRCGADQGHVAELARALEAYFATGPAAPVAAALEQLRGTTRAHQARRLR